MFVEPLPEFRIMRTGNDRFNIQELIQLNVFGWELKWWKYVKLYSFPTPWSWDTLQEAEDYIQCETVAIMKALTPPLIEEGSHKRPLERGREWLAKYHPSQPW